MYSITVKVFRKNFSNYCTNLKIFSYFDIIDFLNLDITKMF